MVGMIRFRTAKSGLDAPFWKVATLPAGRKSIVPKPTGSSGFQSMIALAGPLRRAGLLAERPDPRLLVSLITRLWPGSFK